MATDAKIGFIGMGRMGGALARRLVVSGFAKADQISFSRGTSEPHALESDLAIRRRASSADVWTSSDVIVLAVKPQQLGAVAKSLVGVGGASKLVISAIAGTTTETLERSLPTGARIIRTMPNTPALIGAGCTLMVAGHASDEDESLCRALFETAGVVYSLEKEALLDAGVALSGSGPAYVFMFIEALADGAVDGGIPRKIAQQVAAHTVLGAAKLMLETGQHPGALKDQVTSPGGTTIAAVRALEDRGFRGAVSAAVTAATKRSRELGKG